LQNWVDIDRGIIVHGQVLLVDLSILG